MKSFSQPHRLFQLWAFSPSLKRLLLRSQKEDVPHDHRTRIDVMFWGVQYLEVFTYFRGLEIEAQGASNIAQTRRYLLTSERGTMSIDAADYEWAEDEAEFDAPSSLELK